MCSSTDLSYFAAVGELTAMGITLLGNYAQTGHFGGPLAYTPVVVYSHLAGKTKKFFFYFFFFNRSVKVRRTEVWFGIFATQSSPLVINLCLRVAIVFLCVTHFGSFYMRQWIECIKR
jgi:hypothetical protein